MYNGKIKIIFLSETRRPRANIFWFEGFFCGLQQRLFKGQYWPHLEGHLIYNRENIKKSACQKPEGLELRCML